MREEQALSLDLVTPMVSASRRIVRAADKFWARLIDSQRSIVKNLAVQSGNGCVGFGSLRHFNKSKTSGLAGVAIHDQHDRLDRAVSCE